MRKLWDYSKSIVLAVCIALIFRTFLFEAYKIPSSSMTPNLMIGDYLFISKYSYGYSKYSFPLSFPYISGRVFAHPPQRGDIIVFKATKHGDDKYYIKRLIGLPGDKVQIKDAVLYINDVPVHRQKVGKYYPLYQDEPQGEFICYEETLPNGVKYVTLDANEGENRTFPDQTSVYSVPEGHYFMMGDHRNRSIDSRFVSTIGFVPEENLVGKAQILFWTRDFSFYNIMTKFDIGRLFKRLVNDVTVSIS